MPVPAEYEHRYSNSAVVCAADGCDHRDCHGGPFRVVVLFPERDGDEPITWACVYSSETGAWGELTSLHRICSDSARSSVLVGSSTLYFLTEVGCILEYDMSTHSLTMIDPPHAHQPDYLSNNIMILMVAENGGLGMAEDNNWVLNLWSMEVTKMSDAGHEKWVWVLRRKIYSLGRLLPDRIIMGPIGFAEEANTIFMSTTAGIFVIDLQSDRVKKVCDHEFSCNILVPIVSLGHALPTPRREYHYPPSPNYNEEEEKEVVVAETLEQAHELFLKGRKAIGQRDFVNAIDCLSHALEIRAAHYGEHAPQCLTTYVIYGCALLHKAWEESAKHTTSKTFAGNSKTSDGDVDGAPSLEEGDSEEGQNSNVIAQEDRKGYGDKAHGEMAGDEEDSDLNLAWKMLNIAKTIVEKIRGHIMGRSVSAPGKSASAAERSSKSIQEYEILLTRLLAKLEKKLEDVEQAMSTPSCAAVEIMKRVAPQAEQNVDSAVSRAASLTSSHMAGLNNSFNSPVMPTSSTTESAGSSVTDLGAVGRGIKRANVEPSCAEPSRKRLAVAADDSP